MKRMLAISALLVCLLTSLGCGEQKSSISGTITINGAPMEKGTITFIGEVGAPIAVSIVNGQYQAGPLTPGNYKVAITIARDSVPEQTSGGGSDTSAPPVRPAVSVARKIEISDLYSNPDRSGLKCEINPGKDNRFDYDFNIQ